MLSGKDRSLSERLQESHAGSGIIRSLTSRIFHCYNVYRLPESFLHRETPEACDQGVIVCTVFI